MHLPADLLEIEIYYNKRKFFGAFLFKETISLLKKKISFLSKEEKELSLFMISRSREIFLEQKRARARFHFRKALAGASRGGAPIILDP